MNPEAPAAAVAGVTQSLDAMGVPWFLTGSIASSLHGIPRSTNDLDIVTTLAPSAAGELVRRLGEAYYADEIVIRNAFTHKQSCNVIWLDTMMKVDLMPPRFAFDAEAMRRRIHTHLDDGSGSGLPVAVASAEDIILAKLVWYREGQQTSERQLSDIRGIIAVQAHRLDRVYILDWASRLGLSDQWRILIGTDDPNQESPHQ